METPADLDNLLLWLGQDTATGARQYVEMRQKLVALFEFRGCDASEDLADETLDRTARAILKPGFVFEGNPLAYLRGVARNVYRESLRENRPLSQESLPEIADKVARRPTSESGIESLHACLDRCLAQLPGEKRTLLLRYYQGEQSSKIDGRFRLAQQERVGLNTLRIQLCRLRKVVRQCVEKCTKAQEMELRF